MPNLKEKQIIRLLKRLTGIILPVLFLTLTLSVKSAFADYDSAEIVHHLGETVPLDLTYTNSDGNKVLLKDLINKPTVLDFCYYHCAGICTPLMMEVSDVIGKVKYLPGKDYNIISISIDQNETPQMAADKKKAMTGLAEINVPDSAWMFLTGDSTNIYKLTDATGFRFKRSHGGFLHKGVLIVLDKNGKIVQYLDPGYEKSGDFQILPSGFELAIEKAATGQVTSTIEKVLQTCYSFIPKGNDLLVLMLVLASGLISVAVVFVVIKKAKLNS
jgi:protein SCO1